MRAFSQVRLSLGLVLRRAARLAVVSSACALPRSCATRQFGNLLLQPLLAIGEVLALDLELVRPDGRRSERRRVQIGWSWAVARTSSMPFAEIGTSSHPLMQSELSVEFNGVLLCLTTINLVFGIVRAP